MAFDRARAVAYHHQCIPMMYSPIATWQRVVDAYEQRHEPERIAFLVRTAWYASLGIAACVAIGGLVYGLVSLRGALAALEYSSDLQHNTAPALDKQELLSMVQRVHERALRLESMRGGSTHIPDPSR